LLQIRLLYSPLSSIISEPIFFNIKFWGNFIDWEKGALYPKISRKDFSFIGSPMNSFIDNVAVNARYWGFLFQIPNEKVDLPYTEKQFNLRSLPSGKFEGNIAYNNREGGMHIIRPSINDDEIASSEIVISNFYAMGSMVKKKKDILEF